jgi:hypothetical protein
LSAWRSVLLLERLLVCVVMRRRRVAVPTSSDAKGDRQIPEEASHSFPNPEDLNNIATG